MGLAAAGHLIGSTMLLAALGTRHQTGRAAAARCCEALPPASLVVLPDIVAGDREYYRMDQRR